MTLSNASWWLFGSIGSYYFLTSNIGNYKSKDRRKVQIYVRIRFPRRKCAFWNYIDLRELSNTFDVKSSINLLLIQPNPRPPTVIEDTAVDLSVLELDNFFNSVPHYSSTKCLSASTPKCLSSIAKRSQICSLKSTPRCLEKRRAAEEVRWCSDTRIFSGEPSSYGNPTTQISCLVEDTLKM
jgi:hypothetical protein